MVSQAKKKIHAFTESISANSLVQVLNLVRPIYIQRR